MKIIVNDIAANSGGGLTILKSFYNFLVESNDTNEWIFFICGDFLPETNNIKVRNYKQYKGWLGRLYFDFFKGRKVVKYISPDVVFSMQNTMLFGVECKQILYVHQPLPFQKIKRFSFMKHDERKLALYQYLIGYLIKLSLLFFCHNIALHVLLRLRDVD